MNINDRNAFLTVSYASDASKGIQDLVELQKQQIELLQQIIEVRQQQKEVKKDIERLKHLTGKK